MSDLNKETCPVCGREFDDQYDVVRCPVCGKPHHKQCWMDNGGCFEHSGYNPSREHEMEESQPESNSKLDSADKVKPDISFCPRCGAPVESDAVFCGKCGLDIRAAAVDYESAAGIKGTTPAGMYPPSRYSGTREQTDTSYTQGSDPIAPHDVIQDVRADEISSYVGSNGGVYVKKFFKQEKNGKKTGWSWPAFLFPQCWTVYRRMTVPFIISIVIFAVAISPLIASLFGFYGELSQALGGSISDSQSLLNMIDNLNPTAEMSEGLITHAWNVVLSWFLFVICQLSTGLYFGLYGDHLYKKQAIKHIKELRQRFNQPLPDNNEYRNALSKRGGTRMFLVLIVLALVYIISQLLSLILLRMYL